MTAQTGSAYHRRILEKWLTDKMSEMALASVEQPADGAPHWRRIGEYHAYKEVLDKINDLDKE